MTINPSAKTVTNLLENAPLRLAVLLAKPCTIAATVATTSA